MMGGDASSMQGDDPNAMSGDPNIGMDPNAMGGDPSMQGGDPNMGMDPMMGGDPSMQGDPNAMGDEPMMGSEPFGDSGAEMSSDPEKKIESLIGQAASIIRKELNGDGIDKHEDKKKEVLGMLASAIIDGMDEEQRNGIVDYLSDKLQGEGESDGDTDGGSEDDSLDDAEGGNQDDNMDDMGMEGDMGMEDPNDGQDPSMQQMMESIVRNIVDEITGKDQKRTPASDINQYNYKQGYRSDPYTSRR